jgi:hypothetical protein
MTYNTRYFTPTSEADSAYAWDRLADGVLGHAHRTSATTPRDDLDEAFSHMCRDDLLLLLQIFENLPSEGTGHFYRAVRGAVDSRRTPPAAHVCDGGCRR